MNWQLILVLAIVSVAASYLARSAWRTWGASKRSGCGGGCGCSSKAADATNGNVTLIPSERLTIRRPDRDDTR